jgi:hypothetical protein
MSDTQWAIAGAVLQATFASIYMADNRVKEYGMKVLKCWGRHISGPIFAVLTIAFAILAAIYSGDQSAGIVIARWAAWIFGGLAGVFVITAQYDVWSAERDKVDEETSKNALPELSGEVSAIAVDEKTLFTEGMGADETPYCSFGMKFEIRMHNRRAVKTNMVSADIDSSAVRPPMQCIKLEGQPDLILERGITHNFTLYARAKFFTCPLEDVRNVDIRGMKVSIEDGFGTIHVIPVRLDHPLFSFAYPPF